MPCAASVIPGVAKRAAEAYNRRDVDAFFAELATADVEWWPALVRAVEGGCYQGGAGDRSGRNSGARSATCETLACPSNAVVYRTPRDTLGARP
jgi:hypothetical protein